MSRVPDPPWYRQRRNRPQRDPLTREAIVDATLQLMQAGGLEAVSMRSVAALLQTAPASLYWHVGNKDELLEMAFDRIVGLIELPPPDDPRSFDEKMRTYLHSWREVLLRYRDAGRASLGRVPVGPNFAVQLEWLANLLLAAGYPQELNLFAGDMLSDYVTGHVLEEAAWDVQGNGDSGAQASLRRSGQYLASLPAEDFPHVRAIGAYMLSAPMNDEAARQRFDMGVSIILAGFDAMAKRSR